NALVVRRLLVRRGRAWHLRRNWYTRLSALRTAAVDTPPLTLAARPAPDLPCYAELERWETICRCLDVRPKCRARLPFIGLASAGAANEEPVVELRAMRRYRLVRHTCGCEWVLARRWKEQLQALWQGMERAEREPESAVVASAGTAPARSLCAGLD